MKLSVDEVAVRNSLADGDFKRCYRCFRPKSDCFCEAIPSIENRTGILILQHPRERFHPFNTARIVRLALKNSKLIFGEKRHLATAQLPLQKRTGLLYPSQSAPLLSRLDVDQHPRQLIVVDGTWHQAKTLVRDIPALHELPRFRLAPTSPGRYRIRREPNETSLSTLEATVAALRCLEPETEGFDRLIGAFDSMVERQLAHSSQRPRWIEKESGRKISINIPRTLIHNLESVVVAYGESEEGQRGGSSKCRQPIYWTAQRLVTGETFRCAIQPPTGTLSPSFLDHLELSADDFAGVVSVDEFRERWKNFIKSSDTLAVYGNSTAKLLATVNAEFCRSLALKSIEFNKDRHFKTLSELIEQEKIRVEQVNVPGRAGKRLANAVAFVRHLHGRLGS